MQRHYGRGAWRHGAGDRYAVYFVPDVKIFLFGPLRCGKTPALLSSGVLRQDYKGWKTLGGKTRIRRVDQGVQVEKQQGYRTLKNNECCTHE